MGPLAERAKRALDVAGSAVGLVAAAPVLGVAALLIKAEDRGPVLFRQTRVGRDGVDFDIAVDDVRALAEPGVPVAAEQEVIDRRDVIDPREIERRTGEIDGLGAAARSSLDGLVQISRAIMVSSVNAGLIASRISSSGGPLTVLAAAAQSQALGCSKRIEECTGRVVELIATMEGLGLARVRFELDAVTGATIAPDSYPACTATVTDKCLQTYERQAAR